MLNVIGISIYVVWRNIGAVDQEQFPESMTPS
jgi:hypothetical protein